MSVYEMVTDRILELLERGEVPWHKPWSGGGPAMNLVSRKPYRGINCFLLACSGYASPYWLTLKQANDLGGRVRRGERSTLVVFWKMVEVEDKETGEKRERPFLRYYRVFNVEQCEGIETPESESAEREFNPIDRCNRIIADMPDPPRLQHLHQAAWYKVREDLVNLPRPATFESPEEYYSTAFHELAHSTGHTSRLDRPSLTDMAPFGTCNYSREELVAEMTAAMLCGVTGIVNRTIDQSAAYVQGWLRKLRGDKRLVVQAAAQAQKAADFIQGQHDERPGQGSGPDRAEEGGL